MWGIAVWAQGSPARKAGYRVEKPSDNKNLSVLCHRD
jgi:hypothetical protein